MRGARIILTLAAVSGLASVAFGAFGAHAIADPQAKAWLETGAHYQGLHGLAALAAVQAGRWGARGTTLAAAAFLLGALVFSGALYALAFGAPRVVAIAAPLGGTTMMIGWAALAVAGVRAWRSGESGYG